MLTNATIGSKVFLFNWDEIIGAATITGQTACYWKLSNTQQVKKTLGYYLQGYSKKKKIKVKLWTQESEDLHQIHIEAKRVAAVLSAQKVKLGDYIQYMKTGYFGKLSSDQISNILSVCQDEIGDLSAPLIR